MTARRPCAGPCGQNRAERFYTSPRGRICIDCQRRQRKATARRSHVTRTYGLTPDDYERLVKLQGDRCAVFFNKPAGQELSLDHDHRTGHARGLLSRRANKILSQVGDDPAVLRRLADYLERPPCAVLGIVAIHKDYQQ